MFLTELRLAQKGVGKHACATGGVWHSAGYTKQISSWEFLLKADDGPGSVQEPITLIDAERPCSYLVLGSGFYDVLGSCRVQGLVLFSAGSVWS